MDSDRRLIRTLRYLLLALLMIECLPLNSATALPELGLTWKNVRVGSVKNAVFTTFCDSRGIIWLGTNRGLYFYDGISTHQIDAEKLAGVQIYSIVEYNGQLYIGSNNGLMIYDYRQGRIVKMIKNSPKEIRALMVQGDHLWIGGLNGIFYYDITHQRLLNYSSGLPHRSVYSMLRDSRGVLYVGTYSGMARWDQRHSRFVRIANPGGGALFVNCMLESPDKHGIYVGSEGALYRYIPGSESWERVGLEESCNVKSLAPGEAGHVWVGTDNGAFDLSSDGLKHYRHDSRDELSIADNEIWCVYADSKHNIWAGHERGVSIASITTRISSIRLNRLTHSGEGNEIHSILRDRKQNLWLGGTNGVIRIAEGEAPRWYRHDDSPGALSHNQIRNIYEDSEGVVWLATDAGLNRYNRASDRFEVFHIVDPKGGHTSNWVYAIVEDNDHFWVGSFLNGLHYVAKDKFRRPGDVVIADRSYNTDTHGSDMTLSNDLVNNVLLDGNGCLWVLLFRDDSIIRYDLSTHRSSRYDIYALSGEHPSYTCEDNRGRVWCSFRGGVVLFDGTSPRVVRFPNTNSDETILAMGGVGEDMWVSTQSSVWSIDGKSLKVTLLPIPQKSYTAIYEDRVSNKVYLGGIDEIVEVNSDIASDVADSKIRMILAEGEDGSFDLSDIMGGMHRRVLPYDGNLSLVISSLNYSPESVDRFMYKLARNEADTIGGWVLLPEEVNSIRFADLKMGDYTILLRTVGSGSMPIAIPMRVKPPFYLSIPALLLYALLVIGVTAWIVWYLRRRNLKALHERERENTLENVERKLTFLSTISHDLKTPLSMILGPVSIMKERAKDPDERRSLEKVYDNAVRLNNMIHRTLELQHIEDGGESLLILSTFDVVAFCSGIFEIFREHNRQKTFLFHTSAAEIMIEADAVKLESVMTNLLSNACKYSEPGATISCGISMRDDHVEIVVSDDGVGIPEADRQLVFQRMFRSPATAKLKEGTGLGLYLIKKYLEAMGGNIDLFSRQGEGSSFVVSLPVSKKVAKEVTRMVDQSQSDRPKILIVEDNAQISEFLAEILSADYTTLTADNGRSGLAIAASFLPDLIIVDQMMPIMSGLEMVKSLKQNPRLVGIPIIMLTALSDPGTENESIKQGIDVFMTKPFEAPTLSGRITQLLRRRSELKEHVRIETIIEAESKPIAAESVSEKKLAQIAQIIEENISDPDLNVSLLCKKSDLESKQLYRLIKKYIGLSPIDYIKQVRLRKAAMLLSQHRFTVSEICYMVGFKTPSYFTKCFQQQYGVKPSQYRSDDETVEMME